MTYVRTNFTCIEARLSAEIEGFLREHVQRLTKLGERMPALVRR